MYYDTVSLNADLEALRKMGARTGVIGKTELGRDIPVVMRGSSAGPQVLVVAATHAREYITAPLVIEMMKNYRGDTGVWCVPMLNIDGALLCQYGLASVSKAADREFLNRVNGGSSDYSLWKANARAVDLNVNFNAKWGTGAENVTEPAPANYIGKYPVSESENIALRQLILELQPSVVLSYHTKGEVIYWGFECIRTYRDLAQAIADSTGYLLLESEFSAGGLKDWFTATTFKLGLTIEAVSADATYPIPLELLPEVYQRNKNVLEIASEIAESIG